MEPPSSVLDDYFSQGLTLFLSLLAYVLVYGFELVKNRAGADGNSSDSRSYAQGSLVQLNLFLKFLIVFTLLSLHTVGLPVAVAVALPLILVIESLANFLVVKANKFFAKAIHFTAPIIYILNFPFNIIVKRIEHWFSGNNQEEDVQTLEEVSDDDRNLLKGITSLTKTSVYNIMRPRVEVVAVSTAMSPSQVMSIAVECGFSRLPVYENDIDNIKGFLYVKDMIEYLMEPGESYEWQKHIRDAYFVPGNKKIDDLLEEFRQKKIHLALVVDEYGGTDGIVTLEDVLEEIVGEISDESDKINIIQ